MHLKLDTHFCCNSSFIKVNSALLSEVEMCEKSKI